MKFFRICRDPVIAMAWFDIFSDAEKDVIINGYVDKITKAKTAFSFESFVLMCYNVAMKESKLMGTDMWGKKEVKK